MRITARCSYGPWLPVAALVFAAACADNSPSAPTIARPQLRVVNLPGDGTPELEKLEICKFGGNADIYIEEKQVALGTTSGTYTVTDGLCVESAFFDGRVGYPGDLTVVETPAGGSVNERLEVITATRYPGGIGNFAYTTTTATYYGTNMWVYSQADNDVGFVIKFFNEIRPTNCGTRTIGYWKNHSGQGRGNQGDLVTQHLPVLLGAANGPKSVNVTTNVQAYQILGQGWLGGHPSNGITKLYAQLLAAKLNIADGAAAGSVAATINAADVFLGTHNQADWSSLTQAEKNLVLGWHSTLDNYNNGKIGPGHC